MRAAMLHLIGISFLCTIGLSGCASGPPPQRFIDDNTSSAQDTFTAVQKDSANAGFQESLKKAKAVLIITPGINRASALAPSKNSSQGWAGPAFYKVTMLGADRRVGVMGISAVPHNLKLVVLAMTDKALAEFIRPRLPGTDDLTVYTATGTTTGASRQLAANAAKADLLVFTTREGAENLTRSMAQFGSPLISIDAAANQSYYGRPVTPADILVTQSASNPSSEPLQKTMTIAASQ